MDERVLRFRVGVVVVAAAIITIILITLMGAWPSPFKPHKTIYAEFERVPGVTVNTPVRRSGIQIGRVSNLELLDDGVRLTLKIDDKYKIPGTELPRISSGSMVTGDAIVEFVSAKGPAPGPEFWGNDAVINKAMTLPPPKDPVEMLSKFQEDIGEAIDAFRTASLSVTDVAQKVNGMIGENPPELRPLADQALLAMQNLNQVMDDLQDEDGLKARINLTLDQVDKLFGQAEVTLTKVQETLDQFGRVAIRADDNLANLEGFTKPFGERGEQLSQDIAESVNSVRSLLANLDKLSRSLNNEQGTIGQLINNPELYDRVNRTMGEIEQLIRKLEPIINDIRVFTDKAARDPAQFGVRGIKDKRQPGMGIKFGAVPRLQ